MDRLILIYTILFPFIHPGKHGHLLLAVNHIPIFVPKAGRAVSVMKYRDAVAVTAATLAGFNRSRYYLLRQSDQHIKPTDCFSASYKNT